MKQAHSKIYLPNFWLNGMMPVYFAIFVIIMPAILAFGNYFHSGITRSFLSYIIDPLTSAIMLLITAAIIRRFTTSVVINDKNLQIKSYNKNDVYMLETIKDFYLTTTYYSLGGSGMVKVEFVYRDNEDNNHCLYTTNWGNMLRKRWKKFGNILQEATNRNFTFSYFVEDSDGKIYAEDKLYKEYWKKKFKIQP